MGRQGDERPEAQDQPNDPEPDGPPGHGEPLHPAQAGGAAHIPGEARPVEPGAAGVETLTPVGGASPVPPYGFAGPTAPAGPGTWPPERPRRSTLPPVPVRTHRWGLGAYLVVEAVFLASTGVVFVLIKAFWGLTAGTAAIALSVPTVLAAATALLFTRTRGNGPRADLRLEWSWRDVGLGFAFGVGSLALTIPASLVYVWIVGPDATSSVGEVFKDVRAGPAMAVTVLVLVVLVAPLCEEIVYRGLLWGALERLAGRWTTFAVSTVLFALAHFEFTRTPLLLVVAIPIALARLYTGRLLASIVAHQVNNLLPGIVLMLGLLGHVPMTA